MPLALTDVEATLGLVGVFFVLFPLLVQGLLALAAGQGLGERAANEELARRRHRPGSGAR